MVTFPFVRAIVTTKRWCDTVAETDGYRLLVCRFRPRGVPREGEPWNAFCPELGPSVALHAAFYGKTGEPITWDEYAARYLEEMRSQSYWIRGFAESVARGEALTLLCSSACADATRCHRTILRDLLIEAADALDPQRPIAVAKSAPRVVRRAGR